MTSNKEQETMTGSSQSSFLVMATLASALSMTTTSVHAREEQVAHSMVMEQTYDYSMTYVQEIKYINPNKRNFHNRYANMAQSAWFRKAYENKSVGDMLEVDY